ncbi:mitochondrial RNA polymerase isoform X2 [Megalopta genalis]
MHQPIRTGTTTANSIDLSIMKKKVREKKIYAELLEVMNGKTSNKKAAIQKIKASNITMLVDHCNGLEKCSLKRNMSNKNVSSETSNNIQSENKQQKIPSSSNIHQGKEKNKKQFYSTEKYIESLLAYMQVYLSCKMMNRANKTLMKYRKITQNNLKYSTKCIELYNIILEAYAFRKDLTKVLDLYTMIKNDRVVPTAQTYVYLFDAMGRSNDKIKQLDLLQKLISEMESGGISLNDIFNETHFKYNQYDNVLKVIRLYDPNFKPLYSAMNLQYTSNLVNKVPMRNNYCSPVEGLLTIDKLKSYVKVQHEYEKNIAVEIESINKSQKNRTIITRYEEQVIELENYWKEIALVAFERNLKCLKLKEYHSHNSLMVLHPFLEVLSKEHYINAIIQEVKKVARGSETFSMTLNWLYIGLGKLIYNKYQIQSKMRIGILDKTVEIYQKYLEWYLHPECIEQFNNMNNRTVWQYYERQEKNVGTSLNIICFNWPIDVITNVGKFLYKIILNDLILKPDLLKGQEFKHSIPAFYTLFRNKENYLAEQIKPHPVVSKIYKGAQPNTLTFNSTFIPSNIPPRPWTSVHTGGYLLTSADFIRFTNGSDNHWRELQSTRTQQLYPIFDSLNQLGSIPWKINSPILDIIIKIFQEGGSVELNVPQSTSMLIAPTLLRQDATIPEKRKFFIEMTKFKQEKFDAHSLWCDTLYRLSLANHFRNKIFWLPHNLDFRGRVYPIPPHLNHLTNDLSRSLLLFAKTKPLGPKGLDWLKLHVINLTSQKKGASLKERLEYANENLDNILDSAVKPLTGRMWWKQSEDPWQTLAGCMEIANALKSPNIEEYESGFPIHQDGSCNGLQHYAALGRDQIGAESVNLYPCDVPRDVYATVADMIEKNRITDTLNNVNIAKLLNGFVKRKVIKQTVMTTVYGVTKYGAKLQIVKQLKDIEKFPEEFIWPAGIYLTEQTFSTLRTMFKSAREIQDWLTSCARIISSVCCENIEWVTPLGLPIIQPYIKSVQKSENNKQTIQKPNAIKQKNAFAPNFIHSLDSTHMMLTSIHCKEAGITFVSVHDCFWTHASTVDIMNKICREQFVALHTEPILEDLAKFFIDRYSPIFRTIQTNDKISVEQVHRILTDVPPQGTFDINNVLSSTYFFS